MKKTRIACVLFLGLCAFGFGLMTLCAPEVQAAECYAGPCIDGLREVCCLEWVLASPNCKKCPGSWEWVCRYDACYLTRD